MWVRRKSEGSLGRVRRGRRTRGAAVETRGYLGEQACPATTHQCFRLVRSRVRQDLYFAVRKIYLLAATPGITSRDRSYRASRFLPLSFPLSTRELESPLAPRRITAL